MIFLIHTIFIYSIIGCKLPTVRLYEVIENWKKVTHANIVQLRDVFLTKDFDDEQPCKKLILF